MKKAKLFGLGAIALSAGLLLSACGNGGIQILLIQLVETVHQEQQLQH